MLVEIWCGVCYRISVGTVGQLCKEQNAKIFTTRVSILFVLFTSELEPGNAGYGLYVLGSVVRIPTGARDFSVPQIIHIGSGTLGVKWPGCEDNHSPHIMSRLRMSGAIPPIPHMPVWRAQEELYLLLQ
jgi:hypothetical protein